MIREDWVDLIHDYVDEEEWEDDDFDNGRDPSSDTGHPAEPRANRDWAERYFRSRNACKIPTFPG